MKKISIAILVMLFWAPLVMADRVDEELSDIASQNLKEITRQMIDAGIPGSDAIKMTRLMIQKNSVMKTSSGFNRS